MGYYTSSIRNDVPSFYAVSQSVVEYEKARQNQQYSTKHSRWVIDGQHDDYPTDYIYMR